MKETQHIQDRMNQRAINQTMIDLVMAYGDATGDKLVISKKSANELIKEFEYLLYDLQTN